MQKEQFENFKKLCKNYYRLKVLNDEANLKFEKEKKNFYSKMSEFWKKNKIKDKTFKDEEFSVTSIQSIKVKWDIEKLEKKLNKEQLKKCITKKYEINDIKGLVDYLKSCDISSNDFNKFVKPYITTIKEVNQKAIDKMSDLGEITKNQIEGCYTIDAKEPFYKISALESAKENGNGEKTK